jgi:L-threonylcarbamoyladenylate synthase
LRRKARIYRGTSRNLARLARLLRAGELVAVPTETVYGLAADALNPRACRKIFAAKGRPANDPLIVHIRSWRELAQVAEPNKAAKRLAEKFWPGPLTLVLPKASAVPDIVTSGLPSVAVRAPAHPLLRRLLKLASRPLAAPSANPFGYLSPTTAEHVERQLGRRIGHILDGGPCRIGLESTIVDLRDPRRPRLLRLGAVTKTQIERALGIKLVDSRRTRRDAPIAPGQLPRHYSPRTQLVVHKKLGGGRGRPDEARLYFSRPKGPRTRNVFWLDERGDLRRAARHLYAVLRKIDEGGFRKIHAEFAPAGGLADAINDRLRRAAAR